MVLLQMRLIIVWKIKKSIDLFAKKKRNNYIEYCDNSDEAKVLQSDGCFSCPICREVEGYRSQDFILQIWLKCEKSIHKKDKWFEKKVKYVIQKYFKVTTNDLNMIDDTIKQQNLMKGWNLSRYNYYVFKIASRNGIHLGKTWKNKRLF